VSAKTDSDFPAGNRRKATQPIFQNGLWKKNGRIVYTRERHDINFAVPPCGTSLHRAQISSRFSAFSFCILTSETCIQKTSLAPVKSVRDAVSAIRVIRAIRGSPSTPTDFSLFPDNFSLPAFLSVAAFRVFRVFRGKPLLKNKFSFPKPGKTLAKTQHPIHPQ
jgi:hypothetical protein